MKDGEADRKEVAETVKIAGCMWPIPSPTQRLAEIRGRRVRGGSEPNDVVHDDLKSVKIDLGRDDLRATGGDPVGEEGLKGHEQKE